MKRIAEGPLIPLFPDASPNARQKQIACNVLSLPLHRASRPAANVKMSRAPRRTLTEFERVLCANLQIAPADYLRTKLRGEA